MQRLGSVVAKNSHTLVLKLIQTERCEGCPSNCNQPLFDLFSLRKKLFVIDVDNHSYDLFDPGHLMEGAVKLEQPVKVVIDSNDLLHSSFRMYLIPLFLCLVGMTMGHYLGRHFSLSLDLSTLLGLVFGLWLSFHYLRKKNTAKHLKFRPKVTIY